MSFLQHVRKFLIRKLNATANESFNDFPSMFFLEKYLQKNTAIPTNEWVEFSMKLRKNKDSFDLASAEFKQVNNK